MVSMCSREKHHGNCHHNDHIRTFWWRYRDAFHENAAQTVPAERWTGCAYSLSLCKISHNSRYVSSAFILLWTDINERSQSQSTTKGLYCNPIHLHAFNSSDGMFWKPYRREGRMISTDCLFPCFPSPIPIMAGFCNDRLVVLPLTILVLSWILDEPKGME